MASKSEIAQFLTAEFPQSKFVVVEVGNSSATVMHPVGDAELRLGGTVSGPVLIELGKSLAVDRVPLDSMHSLFDPLVLRRCAMYVLDVPFLNADHCRDTYVRR